MAKDKLQRQRRAALATQEIAFKKLSDIAPFANFLKTYVAEKDKEKIDLVLPDNFWANIDHFNPLAEENSLFCKTITNLQRLNTVLTTRLEQARISYAKLGKTSKENIDLQIHINKLLKEKNKQLMREKRSLVVKNKNEERKTEMMRVRFSKAYSKESRGLTADS